MLGACSEKPEPEAEAVQEKQDLKTHYRRRLRSDKDHIKYLAKELMELHMELSRVELELKKRQSEESSSPTAVNSWSTTETPAEETRIRKREEEISDSEIGMRLRGVEWTTVTAHSRT
ncbi:hypothetical protein PRIC1_009625 [Phytophthora ramorum]